MKARCRLCGESFTLTSEQVSLYEDGHIEMPEVCEDCHSMFDYDVNDTDRFSDADPGL